MENIDTTMREIYLTVRLMQVFFFDLKAIHDPLRGNLPRSARFGLEEAACRCHLPVQMKAVNHFPPALLPIQSSIRKVQAKNGNTPYNVSLAEWECLSTALKIVRQNRAASSHTITPGTDTGT
jgi:hypothetical protein